MFQKKGNLFTLEGVVRFRIINTPAYFNQLAREAYSLFDAEDAPLMLAKIATNNVKENDPDFIPPVFGDKLTKLVSKYSITGGTYTEFFPARVSFNPKEKITIRHDVLAEITIKDGIITKIAPVPLPEPF